MKKVGQKSVHLWFYLCKIIKDGSYRGKKEASQWLPTNGAGRREGLQRSSKGSLRDDEIIVYLDYEDVFTSV